VITRRGFLGCALFAPFSASAAPRLPDLYVSTLGNDAWSGRFSEPSTRGDDGPLASVDEAKARVVELRRREPDRDRAVVVAIRGGIYSLLRPITFGPEDSGTSNSPTIFEAFETERPVFSGGVRLDGWEVTDDGHWSVALTDVAAGKWSFSQLFVNDQRRFRPRLPKQGYLQALDGSSVNKISHGKDQVDPRWSNLGDVEIIVFHAWSASRMRILDTSTAANETQFTSSMWTKPEKDCRFQADNVREAMTKPGQWYLDRPIGRLTYIPKVGELPNKAVVIAPRLEQVLVLRGDFAGKRWVQHIQFRGLTFAHSNWNLPVVGQSFPQAEIGHDAALVAFGARHIVFERCVVRHTGGYAAAFGSASQDNRLEDCEFIDLGAGGVKIGHAGPGDWDDVSRLSDDAEMHVCRHVVRNCLVAHGGRLHPAAVGVWIGQSSQNTVECNEIFDFYQTGISVGWTWGYGRSDARDNEIALNHIHTLGQRVLSDMGGIYTLGVQPGTIVRDNHIHDVDCYDYGGWGLYADEGTSGVVMRRNLVHGAKTGGFYQHLGKENLVTNNVFAYGGRYQLQAPDPEPHVSFRFERNVIYWDNSSPLFLPKCQPESPRCALNFTADYNIYWNALRLPKFPYGLTFDEWQERSLFEAPANGDFRMKAASPAFAMGIRPLDTSLAGRQAVRTLTKDLPFPPAAYP
jgi:hypothetical protein